jgi:hypothetical protein
LAEVLGRQQSPFDMHRSPAWQAPLRAPQSTFWPHPLSKTPQCRGRPWALVHTLALGAQQVKFDRQTWLLGQLGPD